MRIRYNSKDKKTLSIHHTHLSIQSRALASGSWSSNLVLADSYIACKPTRQNTQHGCSLSFSPHLSMKRRSPISAPSFLVVGKDCLSRAQEWIIVWRTFPHYSAEYQLRWCVPTISLLDHACSAPQVQISTGQHACTLANLRYSIHLTLHVRILTWFNHRDCGAHNVRGHFNVLGWFRPEVEDRFYIVRDSSSATDLRIYLLLGVGIETLLS